VPSGSHEENEINKEIATKKVISMKTMIIKSLLTSLCQREEQYPSLAKRGKGRFFDNDALLMHSLVLSRRS
jgi:hypothetical protein